jgi:phytoene dehydrogenase-like protein
MEEFDTIVIGSGVGGLGTAICLARSGQKVLVLEQHSVPGGWSHSFTLGGQRFSPGVHYIGLMDEGQSTDVLYKGLEIANDITFFRMNTKGYDHCEIGDFRFDFPNNFEDLQTRLIEKFPHEEKNIYKYLKLVQQVNEELQLMPKLKAFWKICPFQIEKSNRLAYKRSCFKDCS